MGGAAVPILVVGWKAHQIVVFVLFFFARLYTLFGFTVVSAFLMIMANQYTFKPLSNAHSAWYIRTMGTRSAGMALCARPASKASHQLPHAHSPCAMRLAKKEATKPNCATAKSGPVAALASIKVRRACKKMVDDSNSSVTIAM